MGTPLFTGTESLARRARARLAARYYLAPRPRYWEMAAGIVLAGGLATSGFTYVKTAVTTQLEHHAQEKQYLGVIHQPCAHSEVLNTARCRSWGQAQWTWPDDKTLVKDARDVCAAEKYAGSDVKIASGGMLIAARYPDYPDLQVGLIEVAARQIYCPDAADKIK
jgi:hypothetical protein